MALSRQGKALFARLELEPSLVFKRFQCGFIGKGSPDQLPNDAGGEGNPKRQKLDSVKLGIVRSMISRDSWTVVRVLQNAGFEAYLVGGCVRDLLLRRKPKDFDVITTARLEQVKKQFKRAIIVGQRFPVCHVRKGSLVEVTTFGTVAKQTKRTHIGISQPPASCGPEDFTLWNNSMHRDFTINSLFYDPSRNIIYDYIGAMMDLRSLKLRTIKPAHLSFKEDQARILRAVRLAARLNLSFSRETEAAIYNLHPSVAEISKARLSLEINYMLSYGAAESSLHLLKRFKLLDILLPFQAAYLSERADSQLGPHSLMLMKLFFNLDRLITCDRPCEGSLWVSLLSFHVALFNNPQNAIVVLTFASLLYRGTWEESVEFARKHAPAAQVYVPEMVDVCDPLSDDEIAHRVTEFALQVKKSISVFFDSDSLLKEMARFPEFPCSRLVLISRKMGQRVEDVFKLLMKDVTSLKTDRKCEKINYTLLGEGNTSEIRSVLGRIIIETLAMADLGIPQEHVQPKNSGEIFRPNQHAFKHSREFGRSTSPSNHNLLPGKAGNSSLSRNNDTVSNSRLSRKQRNTNSDFHGDRLTPDSTEKVKNVKTGVQRTVPSLSSLFK